MTTTTRDMQGLMKDAGVDPALVDAIVPDRPLLDQGIDSVDFPAIAVAVEKKYGVNMADADAAKLKTLNDLVALSTVSERAEALRRLAAEPWRMPEQGPFSVGFYTPADGPGVARLFYTVYGDGYPIDTFYLPERLSEEHRAGRIRSVVARIPDGQVVSQVALYRSSPPNPGLYENGLGLTLPSFRSSLAFGRCNQLLLTLPGSEGIDAIFGEAVCNHVVTQKLSLRAGALETALEPALMPARAYEAEQSAEGRVGCVMCFKVYRDVRRPLCLPSCYDGQLRFMLEGLGVDRELIPGDERLPAGAGRLDTVRFAHAGVARCAVQAAGEDLPSLLATLEAELRQEGYAVLQCFVPLGASWGGAVAGALARAGFFLGGLLPVWFGEDGLLLLKLFVDPEFDSMKMYSA
ncbi:MAG: hypothetical protein BWK76_17575, partial [Desulfobulbaceae bacterium A2]